MNENLFKQTHLLLNFQDHPKKKTSLQSQARNMGINREGALVSAGYEVSAVSVGGSRNERDATSNSHKHGVHKISTISEQPQGFRQIDTQSVIRKSHRYFEIKKHEMRIYSFFLYFSVMEI
jgi:hypothetical protein